MSPDSPELHPGKVCNDLFDVEVPEVRGDLDLEGAVGVETDMFVCLLLPM